ncbi:Clp protease ClpP [Crassaminicella thermophila]|uniref:ATP-dependent Clp protease proteolytic subunit n=1 Tax=Crassaminicella thermophila TaxID=2599308 RepID=A0A5C0SFU8_CRATE|nr:head maturation protease, ClpP-related [Crassaminicella thermophila]QEK12587.1 Clp protease ClpP [Crassaminicella thermophila]
MAKINIKGAIVSNDIKWIYEWFEMDATSPKDVENEIEKANGEDLEVEINSGGGDVFAGSEIYTALKSYKGNVEVRIVGIAASAASVIAMAGDKVLISPTAEMMIHNVSSVVRGDYRDLEHEAKVLKDYNSTIANAYMLKSGMSKEKLLSMMNDETWLTPEKALEYKLVDEIMFKNEFKLVASFNPSQILPQEVINKIRNEFKNPINSQKKNESDIFMQKKAYAQLKLLKLKGEIHDE